MLFSKLDVPICIGSNRSEAVALLCKKFKVDLIISDDGLQHYKMSRNYEILMIDSTRMFGNQLMLPLGPLREPINRITSVDYIIFNGLTDNANLVKNKSNATMEIQVCSLIKIKNKTISNLNILNNNSVCAVVGIGNPNRFFNSLKEHCINFNTKIFPDHYAFTSNDFDTIKQDIIVMTEKDAVKCENFAKDNWYFLKVEAALKPDDLDRLFTSINNKVFKGIKHG